MGGAGITSLTERMTINAEKVSGAIVDFLREQTREKKRDGIALGLSGGVDSAVVAALSARAVGAAGVHALYLYERDSQKKFQRYAREVAERLGISFEARDITSLVKEKGAYRSPVAVLPPCLSRFVVRLGWRLYYLVFRESPFTMALKREPVRGRLVRAVYHALGGTIESSFNVKHIQRREILESYATERNLLLVGAANRSEAMVGWFVKDGVDDLPVEPILGLYKTGVHQLARFLGIPQEIIDEPPSPDMFAGMSDESFIGFSYEKMDKVLFVLEHGLSEAAALAEGITLQEFSQIRVLNQLSEWKRRNKHEYPVFE